MIIPRLPTLAELQPHLDRLEKEPGSVLLVAVELPETQNFCRVGVGFFSAPERKALKAALTRCRQRRGEKDLQKPTNNRTT